MDRQTEKLITLPLAHVHGCFTSLQPVSYPVRQVLRPLLIYYTYKQYHIIVQCDPEVTTTDIG